MEIVTVSPKYQVVIPLALRKALGIKPGQKVEVRACDGKIELVPVKPASERPPRKAPEVLPQVPVPNIGPR